MSRRGLAVLLATGALLLTMGLPGGSVAAQSDAIEITVEGPSELAVGDQATYDVVVTAPVELYSAEVAVAIPTDAVTVTAVTGGEFLSRNASSLVGTSGIADGRLTHAESRTNDPTGVTGTGVLVSFTITAEAAGTSQFTIVDAAARDPDVAPLETVTTAREITITGDGATESSDTADDTTDDTGADTTGTTTATATDWPDTVDQTVRTVFRDADTVPVLASTEGDLETLVTAIRDRGARDVTVLASVDIVAFVGDAELVRWVGSQDDVTWVQYDETVETMTSLRVVNASLAATTGQPSSTTTVTATVVNEGTSARTSVIPLSVNTEPVDQQEVTLDPGAEATITFNLTLETAGVYEIAVGDVRAGTLTVETATESQPTTETTAATANEAPGFRFSTGLVALFILLLHARRR